MGRGGLPRVLVTGGAGFIGSHVSEALVGLGKLEVHIADRLNYAGKVRNLARIGPDARFWLGDLKDADFCQRLGLAGFTYVIHMAANTHVDRAIADPCAFTLDNVLGTNRLLEALEKSPEPPKKIVVYSTDEVFGSTPQGSQFDEWAPYDPSNAYSASKVGVEAVCRSYLVTHRTPICIVRPCNTYGRGQHPEKVIPRFTYQALNGEAMTVHNDGLGARDWLHTRDHAAGVILVMEKGRAGESYNLAANDEHTDIELAERISKLAGIGLNVRYVPGRPGHDRRYWMNSGRLRALGWSPSVTFEDGLSDAVEWTLKNRDYWKTDDISQQEAASIAARTPVESVSSR